MTRFLTLLAVLAACTPDATPTDIGDVDSDPDTPVATFDTPESALWNAARRFTLAEDSITVLPVTGKGSAISMTWPSPPPPRSSVAGHRASP